MSEPIFKSINPFSLQEIGSYACLSDDELRICLRSAQHSFRSWRHLPLPDKSAIFKHLGKALRQSAPELAQLMALEMGKHISEGLPEIEKSAQMCDYVAENGATYLNTETLTERGHYELVHEPLGVILGIMPWNYPFWQVIRFACATLMTGNVVLIKHAPNVGQCALALENLFQQALCATLPPTEARGIYQNLFIDTRQVKKILRSDSVQGVSLTGSTKAGQSVGQTAGKHLKTSVLELGGNDALIILDDADIDEAARQAVQSRMRNAGQSCLAPKRFLVTTARASAFTDALYGHIQQIQVGDPFAAHTHMGPLARPDITDSLWRQYSDAVGKGAQVVCGGRHQNNLFWPTLLRGCRQNMAVFREETFGPLACVFEGRDEDSLLAMAQDSRYGLGCAIFSQNEAKARQWARLLNVGNVAINKTVRSAVHIPFGGTKASGYGREMGRWGFHAFSNLKVISL